MLKPLPCLNVCLTLFNLSLHTSGWSVVQVKNHLQLADGFVLMVISKMVVELLGEILLKINSTERHCLFHNA